MEVDGNDQKITGSNATRENATKEEVTDMEADNHSLITPSI